jgi:two-component system, LytTR family, response regulator
MTDPIRTLIVDDEPLARQHLRTLLADEHDIEIIGECGNGRDAVSSIRRDQPALVLLDIQMPELDGLAVVDEVGAEAMPVTIFVTAHDEYAVKAFDAHALDYVMKPVDRERFHEAIARVKERLRDDPSANAPLADFVDHLRAQGTLAPRRIALKHDGRLLFVRIDDIDWIEAADDHVVVHAGRDLYRQRDTLTRLEQRLPANKFLRVHRSSIVNVDRIREMQPWFQGDFVLIMADGTRVTTGRSYRERVREFIEKSV